MTIDNLIQEARMSRRAVFIPLLSILSGCGTNTPNNLGSSGNSSNNPPIITPNNPQTNTPTNPQEPTKYSTTGVEGLNTPSDILLNSSVRRNIERFAENFGDLPSPLQADSKINPPYIAGTYDLGGYMGQQSIQFLPFFAEIGSGTWKWLNQTPYNTIDTYFKEFLGGNQVQTAVSTKGEIIRGEGDLFTVYSIIDGEISGCKARAVAIMNGGITEDRMAVLGTYHNTIMQNLSLNPECTTYDTSGAFVFPKRGTKL